MPLPSQVEVDWMSRVVRWSVDGGSAVAVAVPDDWTSRCLPVWLVAFDHTICTATLLESIVIPASPALLARAGGVSASGSSKGRHSAAAAASALH